ncbi:hypothetical protein K4F52_003003 [Lecanicillium sp. MT-2017a]|nr:hypothetical protein K4F52_003003 [Lecanicillium sp. MT-2017a]
MPDVASNLEFLVDADRYKNERPYIYTPRQQAEDKMDTSRATLNTIDLELKPVTFRDIRGKEDHVGLEKVGFEVASHDTKHGDFASLIESKGTREMYRQETAEFLKARYNAEDVVCYSVKVSSS